MGEWKIMSLTLTAWTALKNQLKTDSVLATTIKKFKFSRQEQIFQKSFFPLLVTYPSNINDENIGMPKQKLSLLEIDFFVKGSHTDGESLEDLLLELDSKIKNAIEKDYTLGGTALLIDVGESSFSFLDKEYGESSFKLTITLPRFTAGNR